MYHVRCLPPPLRFRQSKNFASQCLRPHFIQETKRRSELGIVTVMRTARLFTRRPLASCSLLPRPWPLGSRSVVSHTPFLPSLTDVGTSPFDNPSSMIASRYSKPV